MDHRKEREKTVDKQVTEAARSPSARRIEPFSLRLVPQIGAGGLEATSFLHFFFF